MKYTDFFRTIKRIKQHLTKELEAAVRAHGGSYTWEDEDECPIVAANPERCDPDPLDICINSVSLDSHGVLQFEATEKLSGYEISELSVDDIFVEHLGFIIEYMEETPTVSDVSIPFKL